MLSDEAGGRILWLPHVRASWLYQGLVSAFWSGVDHTGWEASWERNNGSWAFSVRRGALQSIQRRYTSRPVYFLGKSLIGLFSFTQIHATIFLACRETRVIQSTRLVRLLTRIGFGTATIGSTSRIWRCTGERFGRPQSDNDAKYLLITGHSPASRIFMVKVLPRLLNDIGFVLIAQ